MQYTFPKNSSPFYSYLVKQFDRLVTSSDAEDSGGARARARRSATGLLFLVAFSFCARVSFRAQLQIDATNTLRSRTYPKCRSLKFHAAAGFQRQTVALFWLSPSQ